MNRRGFLGSLAGVAALSIFFKKPPVFPEPVSGRARLIMAENGVRFREIYGKGYYIVNLTEQA